MSEVTAFEWNSRIFGFFSGMELKGESTILPASVPLARRNSFLGSRKQRVVNFYLPASSIPLLRKVPGF